jgi:carbon-monoxide dehydrogenase large subunit
MDKKPQSNSYVGSPVERIEDLRFLRGRGEYVDDVKRADVLHAVFLRSSIAHGLIRSVDVARARQMPGVKAVISAADIGPVVPKIPMRQEPLPAFKFFEQPVIATDRVRYVGEPIVVVVAESAAQAEDALEAIDLDIEPIPAVATREAALADDSILFPDAGSNRAMTMTAVRGDIDQAFQRAAYTRRERFSVQRHSAVPLEPRGLMAEWDSRNEKVTLFGVAKVPFPNQRSLGIFRFAPFRLSLGASCFA